MLYIVFFKIFYVIFSIAKSVQHHGRLPFGKPASVFAYYVCIVISFANWRHKYSSSSLKYSISPFSDTDYTDFVN